MILIFEKQSTLSVNLIDQINLKCILSDNKLRQYFKKKMNDFETQLLFDTNYNNSNDSIRQQWL